MQALIVTQSVLMRWLSCCFLQGNRMRAASMVMPSSAPDALTGIRAARRAAAVRLSQDSPTEFRARQLNAQPPSFSQWSLVMPAPSPAESRPSSSLRSPAARQASGEYAQRSEHLLARSPQSTSRNQSRSNPNPPPQTEDDAEAVAYIFNQCVSTYSSSHDIISALELTHLVGVGSMGTVYRASLLGQQVVCKVRLTSFSPGGVPQSCECPNGHGYVIVHKSHTYVNARPALHLCSLWH